MAVGEVMQSCRRLHPVGTGHLPYPIGLSMDAGCWGVRLVKQLWCGSPGEVGGQIQGAGGGRRMAACALLM